MFRRFYRWTGSEYWLSGRWSLVTLVGVWITSTVDNRTKMRLRTKVHPQCESYGKIVCFQTWLVSSRLASWHETRSPWTHPQLRPWLRTFTTSRTLCPCEIEWTIKITLRTHSPPQHTHESSRRLRKKWQEGEKYENWKLQDPQTCNNYPIVRHFGRLHSHGSGNWKFVLRI